MDKLKIFLAAVEKHQFWVCCGVMLLTSLGCWWCASEDEARRFVTRKTAIDGDFSGAVVQSGAPNKGVIDKIKQQDDELKLKVFDAWRALYTEQKKNDPFPTKLLGEEFKKEFQKLQLPKDQLDPIYLEIYENHIRDYLPALEEIVKVRHEVVKEGETAPRGGLGIPPMQPGVRPGFGGGRMGGIMPPPNARGNPMIPRGPGIGPGADAEKEYTGIVDWDDGDLGQVQTHFYWGGRAPTTLEVVMAQEDLGVYETLLRIIKKVNEGATAQPNAAIKQIVALDIGKDSARAWDNARKASLASSGGGGPSSTGLPGGSGGVSATPASISADQQGEQALFDGRYVNDKGEPLPYIAEYPHAAHPNSEFKMMPFCMNLVMDQRRLPTLLVQFANSDMPIEVRLVRILKQPDFVAAGPAASPAGNPAGMNRIMPPAGIQGRPRSGPVPSRRDSGPVAPRGTSTTQDTTGQFDVPVEIYAVLYIYNPPDRAKLGIPEEKTPAEAAAPANATSPPTNGAAAQPLPAAAPGK